MPLTIPTAPRGPANRLCCLDGLPDWLRCCFQAEEFCLDFHAIPFRGEPEVLDNHYLPTRGKAAPSVLSFFAYEPQSRVLCYSNANLTRDGQAEELMRFVEFWHDLTDHDPQ